MATDQKLSVILKQTMDGCTPEKMISFVQNVTWHVTHSISESESEMKS